MASKISLHRVAYNETVSEVTYIIFIALLISVSLMVRIYTFGRLGQSIIKDIRDQALKHILALSYHHFEKFEVGDLVMRITSDAQTVRLLIVGNLSSLLRNVILIAGSFAAMCFISKTASLYFLLCFTTTSLPLFYLTRKLDSFIRIGQKETGELGGLSEQFISGIKTVKMLACQNRLLKKFYQKTSDVADVLNKHVAYFSIVNAVSFLAPFVIVGGLFLITLNEGFGQKLTFEQLPSLFYYILIISRSFTELNTLNGSFSNLKISVQRLSELFQVDEKDSYSQLKTKNFNENVHSIEFRKVSFSYPSNPYNFVLKNLSFKILKGEKVAIYGPSGRGKSTIFSLIASLYHPASGQILINNKDIRYYSASSLNKKLSFILQESFIFTKDLAYDITLGTNTKDLNAIQKKAELAKIEDLFTNESIGSKGFCLSGGQKQRVQIVRALLAKTNFYLMDEPSSALDDENEKNIIENCFLKNKKATVLLITHKKSMLKLCDRVIMLKKDNK